jgi:hypothetical protein
VAIEIGCLNRRETCSTYPSLGSGPISAALNFKPRESKKLVSSHYAFTFLKMRWPAARLGRGLRAIVSRASIAPGASLTSCSLLSTFEGKGTREDASQQPMMRPIRPPQMSLLERLRIPSSSRISKQSEM